MSAWITGVAGLLGAGALAALSDRMAALGDRLEVRSAPGRGTTGAGRIPAHALA